MSASSTIKVAALLAMVSVLPPRVFGESLSSPLARDSGLEALTLDAPSAWLLSQGRLVLTASSSARAFLPRGSLRASLGRHAELSVGRQAYDEWCDCKAKVSGTYVAGFRMGTRLTIREQPLGLSLGLLRSINPAGGDDQKVSFSKAHAAVGTRFRRLSLSLGTSVWQTRGTGGQVSNLLAPSFALQWTDGSSARTDIMLELSREPKLGVSPSAAQWVGAIGTRPRPFEWGAAELWVRGGVGQGPFIMVAVRVVMEPLKARQAL